jgi:hypothetical protein
VGGGHATPGRHRDTPGDRRRLLDRHDLCRFTRRVYRSSLASLVAELSRRQQLQNYPARGWPDVSRPPALASYRALGAGLTVPCCSSQPPGSC